jgi:hypothetical protein
MHAHSEQGCSIINCSIHYHINSVQPHAAIVRCAYNNCDLLPCPADHTLRTPLLSPILQAAGSQGVDLQRTYKQLASSKASHALRFAAVYTDGGCDGMPDDLTYWVS